MNVTDAMSVKDIQTVAIKARLADVVLEGKSDEYVAGIFDSLSVAPAKQSTNSRHPVLPPSGLTESQRRGLCGMEA